MTKLEEVARAIGGKRGDYSDAGWLGPETHAMALDEARAAVEALRVPSRFMVAAMPWGSAEAWRIGIDAILKEKP
jgi:hypothetical protein